MYCVTGEREEEREEGKKMCTEYRTYLVVMSALVDKGVKSSQGLCFKPREMTMLAPMHKYELVCLAKVCRIPHLVV